MVKSKSKSLCEEYLAIIALYYLTGRLFERNALKRITKEKSTSGRVPDFEVENFLIEIKTAVNKQLFECLNTLHRIANNLNEKLASAPFRCEVRLSDWNACHKYLKKRKNKSHLQNTIESMLKNGSTDSIDPLREVGLNITIREKSKEFYEDSVFASLGGFLPWESMFSSVHHYFEKAFLQLTSVQNHEIYRKVITLYSPDSFNYLPIEIVEDQIAKSYQRFLFNCFRKKEPSIKDIPDIDIVIILESGETRHPRIITIHKDRMAVLN